MIIPFRVHLGLSLYSKFLLCISFIIFQKQKKWQRFRSSDLDLQIFNNNLLVISKATYRWVIMVRYTPILNENILISFKKRISWHTDIQIFIYAQKSSYTASYHKRSWFCEQNELHNFLLILETSMRQRTPCMLP